jgi:cobyrinic acid a,c-diamide synthase
MVKGIVIAATHSGAGKTTLTLGLMAALQRRGLTVAPFKVGPDFIDPGHHTHVAGRASRNLDGWMLRRIDNQANFQRHVRRCDVAVVEGVMGLYDGFSGSSEAGSTAQIAKWLNLPVLLVVNAASMARSAAALVQGFERFDPQLQFAGVVFNNLGSKGHLSYLKDAMATYVDMPLLGGLLRDEQLYMPERHLGLTTAQDRPLAASQVNRLADHIEDGMDLDRLLESLPQIHMDEAIQKHAGAPTAPKVRVGVARDRAFCFYYPENLELLEAAGAELVSFSPLADESLPPGLGGIYFGGGYPELHARNLAENKKMRTMIRNCSRKAMPIYGECGGFMYLCRELEDDAGKMHPMCNCFPFRSRMHPTLRTLGYRQVCLTTDTVLGSKGQLLRGHEFHYSDLVDIHAQQVETRYKVQSRKGVDSKTEGFCVKQTLGSYIHLHFGSNPDCARVFADACRTFIQSESATVG